MKKFYCLSISLFIVFLFFSISNHTFAQITPSIGLAPANHLKHKTKEKRDIIQLDDFATAYGIAFNFSPLNVNQYFTVPVPTGIPFNIINSNIGNTIVGADFDINGNLYATQYNYPNMQLITIDKYTGTSTVITNISGIDPNQNISSIGYSPPNSTMYLSTTDLTISELYKLNIQTGVSTLIDTVTNCAALITIAVNCEGKIYGIDSYYTNLILINDSTAEGTIIGPLGFYPKYTQDADFDFASNKMYLAAFNSVTNQAELRNVNINTGYATLLKTFPDKEITAFAIDGNCENCLVESAANPFPSNGANSISINLSQLTWENGTGSISNEVYFGTNPGNMTLVQSDTLATSWTIDSSYLPLDYETPYYWKIVEIGDTCSSVSPTWYFTTGRELLTTIVISEDFESGCGNWTITNDGGTCVWDCSHDASEYMMGSTGASGFVMAADADFCGSGTITMSTATYNFLLDATQYSTYYLEFDEDWKTNSPEDEAYVEVSIDSGSTWQPVLSYIGEDARDQHVFLNFSNIVSGHKFLLRFRTVQPGWDWWWAIDNIMSEVPVTPVEINSFSGVVNKDKILLSWQTATEKNNKGFVVQRKTINEKYKVLSFINGNGTTTDNHNYSFTDSKVKPGNYTYRLKQIDFDGSVEYSNEINVNVESPAVYSLEQNYPNPFNPSTKINFSLTSDSKVNLKVFDILGREVEELINNNLQAGSHSINFNAENLPSGIYIYRLEAIGKDGKNFASVKKMILTK